MTAKITATFDGDYRSAKEAGHAAVPIYETPSERLMRQLQFWITFALVTFALVSLALLVLEPNAGITLFYLIFGSAIVSFGLLNAGLLAERSAFVRFSTTSFGKGATITLDEKAVTLTTKHSTWKTGWSDVIDVFQTANTVGITTPVMPIYIPASALEDSHSVFAAMKSWHKAAQG